MKKIPLLVTPDSDINYLKNMRALLQLPLNPEKHTSYAEMAKVIPVLLKAQALPDDAPFMLVEDKEHEIIVERFMNAKWDGNSPEIFDMINDIRDAPECEVKLASLS